jgi:hypothetical protein
MNYYIILYNYIKLLDNIVHWIQCSKNHGKDKGWYTFDALGMNSLWKPPNKWLCPTCMMKNDGNII